MADAVGNVQYIEGKFFVQDANGKIIELKQGDDITADMKVYGDPSNTKSAQIGIHILNTKDIVVVKEDGEQFFDKYLSEDLDAEFMEIALAPENVKSALNDAIFSDNEANDKLEAEDEDILEEDVEAGQEKAKDTEEGGLEFAARDNGITDVNSDLRKARFQAKSQTFEIKNQFEREDDKGLEKIERKTFEFDPRPSPTPPSPTPPTPPSPEPKPKPEPQQPVRMAELRIDGDEAVNEGESASYILNVSDAPLRDMNVQIRFTHIDTDSSDISLETRTLTILAGQTSVSFTKDNFSDHKVEGGEDYSVSIIGYEKAGFAKVTVTNPSVRTTILDKLPTLTIDDKTAVEEAGTMTFTITLSDYLDQDVTFNYSSANSSAIAANDYTAVSGVGTIPAGQTSTQITVPIIDDYYKENTEQFYINLSNVSSNATIADNQGIGTILDTGHEPNTTQDVDTVYLRLDTNDSVKEDANATLTHKIHLVDKDGNSVNLANGETIKIALAYSSDTTQDADYINNTRTTTFIITGDGGSDYSFDNTIVDDYLNETSESYTLKIDSVVDAGTYFENVVIDTGNNSATGTITDGADDEVPNQDVDTLYVKIIGNDTKAEGSNLTHTVVLVDKDGTPVTVAAGETITVTIGYAGSGSDYAESEDYTATTSVDITAGTSQTIFTNRALEDFFDENTEQYTATITNVAQSNATYENVMPSTTANGASVDAISVTGNITNVSQNINPDNAYVDEDDFTPANPNTLVGNPTLFNLTTELDNTEYAFAFEEALVLNSDADTNLSVVSTGNARFTSNGTKILYEVSSSTLRAFTDAGDKQGSKVFDIVLSNNTNDDGSDDGYIYTQYKEIDHPTSGDAGTPANDDTLTMEFGFRIKATNGTDQSSIKNFTVTVNDSLPNSINTTYDVDEDSSKVITLSEEGFNNGEITLDNRVDAPANVASGNSIDIYDADGDDVVGTLTNNGNGNLTFTPYGDYSGATSGFSYDNLTDTDGDTASGVIGLNVVPEADAATIESGGNTVNEDTAVTINLHAPLISDDTDKNNTGGATAGDYPELLGLISLDNMNSGVKILKGADDSVLWTSTGTTSSLYILLSDADHTQDVIDAFAPDANHLSMTTAEFEALKVNPIAQDHRDIDIKMHVTEYEVDSSGNILADADVVGSNGKTTDKTFHVEVEAVSDDINLYFDNKFDGADTISNSGDTDNNPNNDTYTVGGANNLNEGINVIDLQAILMPTAGSSDDTVDGSEHRSYTVSGIPEGSVVSVGGSSATVASGQTSVTVNFPDNTQTDPAFTMTTPQYFSGNINATIELNVTDTDSDSSVTPATNTETVYFNVYVDAVANIATMSVRQPKGDEDAGRDASGTITSPQNGIPVDVKVSSLDTDGSEYFNLTIDDIPDGASMYIYDTSSTLWKLVDDTNSGTEGNLVFAEGTSANTWKVTINHYDISDGTHTTNMPKFIPAHNSNVDATLQITATTQDTTGAPITTAPLAVDIQVTGVADDVVNNELKSVDRDNDPTDDADDIYASVYDESNTGTLISNDVFVTPLLVNSYDNTTNGGAEASESLSMVITGLDASFDLTGSGAVFINGTGADRKWVIDSNNANDVNIKTPASYAGEVDFQLGYITTEDDGDSKTSDLQDVKVLVKPLAEATIEGSTDVLEDELTALNHSVITNDSNEEIGAVKIKIADVEGKDFTLYLDNSTDHPISELGDGDGDGYYLLNVNQLYVKYNDNYGGTLNQSDTFEIKYTTTDKIDAAHMSDGRGDLVVSSAEHTLNYTINLKAVTDGISIDATAVDDVGSMIDVNGDIVTINETGSFNVDLDISALTNADSTNTSADLDGSESVTRLVISNVPDGISVTDGVLASSGDTNIWFVDIDPDTVLDEATETYQLTFTVHDQLTTDPDTGTSTEITIKAYNEDLNADNTETAITTLTFIDNISGSAGGPVDLIEANLTVESYEVVEDTNFNLANIITVTPDSDTAYDSGVYSVTIKNLSHVELADPTSMTSYELNGNTVYEISGNKDNIMAKLAAIDLKPDLNFNENNDGGSELSLDITLTSYMPNSSNKSTADATFSDSEVTPVTDIVEAVTTVNQGNETLEDETYDIDISLSTVDDPDFDYVQDMLGGAVSTIEFTHVSGIIGTLSWDGGTQELGSGTTTVAIPYDELDNLQFTPKLHESGNINITYDVYTQEYGASNIEKATGNINITVKPVADGLNLSNLGGSDDEDNFIVVTYDGTNNIGQATMIDSSEQITSLFIDGVPNGFLVYAGDTSTLAQNAGDNGSGKNTWSIPVNAGDVPDVWIKAPQNWSGTLSGLTLKTYVNDSGSTVLNENSFSITVNSVADAITIDPTRSFNDEYNWTDINLNANMVDLDGSETMSIVFNAKAGSDALDDSALFKLADGTELSHTFNAGVYTITGIAYDQMDSIKMLYHDYSGTIEIKAQTEDRTDGINVDDTSAFTSVEEFELSLTNSTTIDLSAESRDMTIYGSADADNITAGSGDDTINAGDGNDTINGGAGADIINGEAGDDTITTDGNDTVDGGSGTDTIKLENGASFDFSKLDNIEIIDLTDNGNHEITGMKLSDIVGMTDSDNELAIRGDASDNVASITEDVTIGSELNEWSKATTDNGSSITYEYSKNDGSESISLTIDDNINNTGL